MFKISHLYRLSIIILILGSFLELEGLNAQSYKPGEISYVLTTIDCQMQSSEIPHELQYLHRCDYIAKFPGLFPADRFGWTIAYGQQGPLNSSKPGLVIGAPFAEGGKENGNGDQRSDLAGSAFLFSFNTGVWQPENIMSAPFPYDPYFFNHRIDVSDQEIGARMGWALAWINSRDSSAFNKFALGAPFADTSVQVWVSQPNPRLPGYPGWYEWRPKYINGGLVYLISGENGQIITRLIPPTKPYGDGDFETPEPENWFGLSLVYSEHYYGTGNPDPNKSDPVLVVGAPGPGLAGLNNPSASRNSGYVAIYSLATGVPVWAETIRPDDQQEGQQFGFSVSVMWNQSQEKGYLAVGSPFHDGIGDSSGRIYVYEAGNPSQLIFWEGGAAPGARLGHASTFLCYNDPSRATCPDAIAVSSPMFDGNRGRVSIFTLSGAERTLEGERTGDRFGWSLAAAGNQDGYMPIDGLDELLIGAPMFDVTSVSGYVVPHSEMGRVYMYYSQGNYALYQVLDGEDILDRFGWSVGASDVDSDGNKEIFIGAAWADQYVPLECGGYRGFSGSVYVYKESKFYIP